MIIKIYCQNRPNLTSNAQKCVGGWGSAPDPAGGAYDAPPDPLIVRSFTPKSEILAPPLEIGVPANGYLQLHHCLYIDVIFDQNLSFSDHITHLSRSCFMDIRNLPTIRLLLDFKNQNCIHNYYRGMHL